MICDEPICVARSLSRISYHYPRTEFTEFNIHRHCDSKTVHDTILCSNKSNSYLYMSCINQEEARCYWKEVGHSL